MLIVLAGAGLVLLVAGAARRSSLLALVGFVLATGALFVAPAAWAIDVSGQREFGSIPVAGPELEFIGRGFSPVTTDGLAAYLDAHRNGERWDAAVVDGIGAAPLILDGLRVAALGGFLGADPAGTPDSVAKLIEQGKLRFVLAIPPAFGFAITSTPAIEAVNEVRSTCRHADLGKLAEDEEAAQPESPFAANWRDILYDCKGVRLGS